MEGICYASLMSHRLKFLPSMIAVLAFGASAQVLAADPPACAEDGTCETGSCFDGLCRTDGVVCTNDAGACFVADGHGECSCIDGYGSGWSDGFNPDDPPEVPTEAELFERCNAHLAETCGTEAPTLSPACVGEVHTACETSTARLLEFMRLCGDEPPGATLGVVNRCCEYFDDPYGATLRECVLGTTATTCEAFQEECFSGGGDPEGSEGGDEADTDAAGGDEGDDPDVPNDSAASGAGDDGGEPTGDTDDAAAGEGEASEEEEEPFQCATGADTAKGGCSMAEKGGCSIGAPASGAGWLVVLLAFYRRRRSLA